MRNDSQNTSNPTAFKLALASPDKRTGCERRHGKTQIYKCRYPWRTQHGRDAGAQEITAVHKLYGINSFGCQRLSCTNPPASALHRSNINVYGKWLCSTVVPTWYSSATTVSLADFVGFDRMCLLSVLYLLYQGLIVCIAIRNRFWQYSRQFQPGKDQLYKSFEIPIRFKLIGPIILSRQIIFSKG